MKIILLTGFYFIITLSFCCATETEDDIDPVILEFAKFIEESVYEGNYHFLDQSFNFEKMLQRIIVENDDSDLKQFNLGFKEGLRKQSLIGAQIGLSIGNSGLYSFIRYYQKDSIHHLIFRIFGKGGLNYHDYEVELNEGTPEIVDFFIYITGENFSKTMKDIYLSALQQLNYLNKLNDQEGMNLQDMQYALEAKNLFQKAKYKESYKILNKTSEAFKQNKLFIIYKSMILSQLDQKKYLDFLIKCNQSNHNNPSLYLFSLDVYFLNKEYAKLLSTIDSLDKMVGGDPILNLYRGNVYFDQADYTKAITIYEQLMSDLPLYSYGYTGLLFSFINLEDYINSTRMLSEISNIFGYSIKEIESILEEFKPFLKSNAYKEWKRSYKSF